MTYMKAKEIMNKYNISRNTLCNWVRKGIIEVEILPSGRYNYLPNEKSVSNDTDINILKLMFFEKNKK